MTSVNKQKILKGIFSKPIWWTLFLAATFLMSLWFQTFKAFTLHPNMINGLLWLAVMFILIVNIAVLAYDSYLLEKSKGKIHKPVRFFEWLRERRFLIVAHDSSKDATL